jgi:hypothetical protein
MEMTYTHVPQILHEDAIHFAEVHFYFLKSFGGTPRALALVSLYSSPDEHLLSQSHATLLVCWHQRAILTVIDVKSILSVVAMVPFPFSVAGHVDQFFVIEKIGLDVVEVDDNVDDE